MNLKEFNWPERTSGERRAIMVDLAYYLLEASNVPLDRIELGRAMRAYSEKQGVATNTTRAQWRRWSGYALNEHAAHRRANNPRMIEAARYKAGLRHERLAHRLERAVDKLLPDDVLDEGRTLSEGFQDDVKAATLAVAQIVNIDKLRAAIYRWAERPADEAGTEATEAETLRMLELFLAERATPEMVAKIVEMAKAQTTQEADQGILDEVGLGPSVH